MTLQALIQKMKEAGGPDRELDGLIAWHLCGVREQVMSANKRWEVELFPEETQLAVYLAICRLCETERPYTSSIDCALTLCASIHPEYFWCIETTFGTPRATFAGRVIDAPTPALALCIAALEARQKMKEAM